MQLTPHFTLEEMIWSPTALENQIDNTLPGDLMQAMKFTALGAERIRACLLGLPCKTLSGYRCEILNAMVGGQSYSQHIRAEAWDFICPGFGKPHEVGIRLQSNMRMLGIDQLILEKSWVHASFTENPRYEVLTIRNGITIKGIA